MNTNAHGAAVADEAAPVYEKYSPGHLWAYRLWEANGMTCRGLKEDTLTQLLEDRNFRDAVTTERERLAKAAAPQPTAPRPAAQSAHSWRKDEDSSEWATRVPLAPAPLFALNCVFRVFVEVTKQQREKRAELEADVRRLESLLVLATRRLDALEANTKAAPSGIRWAGQHSPGRRYFVGEFVKRIDGSVWSCIADTTSAPGMAPDAWELVSKAQGPK